MLHVSDFTFCHHSGNIAEGRRTAEPCWSTGVERAANKTAAIGKKRKSETCNLLKCCTFGTLLFSHYFRREHSGGGRRTVEPCWSSTRRSALLPYPRRRRRRRRRLGKNASPKRATF